LEEVKQGDECIKDISQVIVMRGKSSTSKEDLKMSELAPISSKELSSNSMHVIKDLNGVMLQVEIITEGGRGIENMIQLLLS